MCNILSTIASHITLKAFNCFTFRVIYSPITYNNACLTTVGTWSIIMFMSITGLVHREADLSKKKAFFYSYSLFSDYHFIPVPRTKSAGSAGGTGTFPTLLRPDKESRGRRYKLLNTQSEFAGSCWMCVKLSRGCLASWGRPRAALSRGWAGLVSADDLTALPASPLRLSSLLHQLTVPQGRDLSPHTPLHRCPNLIWLILPVLHSASFLWQ